MPFGYRPNGYTEADQRSDTSFLVGVRYGESVQRKVIAKRLEALAKTYNDDTSWWTKEISSLVKELTGE